MTFAPKSMTLIVRSTAILFLFSGCLAVSPSASAQAVIDALINSPDTFIRSDTVLFDEDAGVTDELPMLFSGEVPANLQQLHEMELHFGELYEDVRGAVVNVNTGDGQGSGVVVSSDGYVLTAAHVIGRPGREVLITFDDGTHAIGTSLGLSRGMDSGMVKINRMIDRPAELPDVSKSEGDDTDAVPVVPLEQDLKPEPSDSDDATDGNEDEDQDESATDDDETTTADNAKKPADDKEASDEPANDDEAADESSAVEEELVELPRFDYLDIGLSDEVKPGQWVMAIGHPGGRDEDRGLVVRVGRVIENRSSTIQTDCTLVGGDSGGPLIDMAGNVVGIHSRIGGSLFDNQHVPIDKFSENWDRLDEGYILDRASSIGCKFSGDTNRVEAVLRNQASWRAGVKEGDRIVSIGDAKVESKADIATALLKLRPYQKVDLVVKRAGSRKTITLTLGERRRTRTRR